MIVRSSRLHENKYAIVIVYVRVQAWGTKQVKEIMFIKERKQTTR